MGIPWRRCVQSTLRTWHSRVVTSRNGFTWPTTQVRRSKPFFSDMSTYQDGPISYSTRKRLNTKMDVSRNLFAAHSMRLATRPRCWAEFKDTRMMATLYPNDMMCIWTIHEYRVTAVDLKRIASNWYLFLRKRYQKPVWRDHATVPMVLFLPEPGLRS